MTCGAALYLALHELWAPARAPGAAARFLSAYLNAAEINP